MKGALVWLVCWACADIVGPVHIMFFLTLHFFSSFVPIAQQAGQAVVVGHLSHNVCLSNLQAIIWGSSEVSM